VFVEGGGVTISRFLDGGHLDRLHLTIAPMLMGGGRPALRFGAAPSLSACARPESRVFRMGQDLLFDCDLRSTAGAGGDGREGSTALSRVR
jgi:riboflavin biosynthesis pyrimidine reductase